jgi:predicted secreted protein
VSYNVALPFSLKINISDLLTNWTGTSLSVQDVSNSTEGGTVTKNSTYIFYIPPTGSPTSPDTIPYTVSGTNGCSTAAFINVLFAAQPGGAAQHITVVGGVATVNFAGIPGYPYIVQRAEDANFTTNLTTVLTTNAPAGGLFTCEDNTSLTQAYYRLKYNP